MTTIAVVDNIFNVLKLLFIDIIINIQTQVVSPGQDELTDPQAMDHTAREW